MISLFLRSSMCCCGIESVRSKVVSFESSFETKGLFIEKSNCLTKPSVFSSFFQIFPSSSLQINFTVYINIIYQYLRYTIVIFRFPCAIYNSPFPSSNSEIFTIINATQLRFVKRLVFICSMFMLSVLFFFTNEHDVLMVLLLYYRGMS